jgi:CBS domain containing-hemolysin-like protein
VLLTAALCGISTANYSLRGFSRARLTELAERTGRMHRVELLARRLNEFTLMVSTARMALTLILVLVIAHVFRAWQGSLFWHYAVTFLISVALVSVFGVVVPNAWAKYAGEPLLLATVPAFSLSRMVVWPILSCLHLFDGLVRRLAGVPAQEQESNAEQIEQEILSVVSEGEAHGAVDEEEKEMIESVIQLDELQVGEIMTPRTEIVALPTTATLFEAKELIAKEGHSRIPVYDEALDNVLGVLYAKDLLLLDRTADFDPTRVMRKVPFVPETKRIRELLREFRQNKVHIAIVLDEYGGTAGLITIEDIVEELVGEITDEFEPPAPESMRRIDADTLEIDARVHVKDLNEELGISLPEDADYETVGGFVFSTLGRIPDTGEELEYQNVHIVVLDAEERKINRLRIHVIRQPQEAGSHES